MQLRVSTFYWIELVTALMQMFARELAADWTSWGNEVLRFQTLDNFELCEC